ILPVSTSARYRDNVDYWRNRQPIYPLINDVFTNSTPFSSEPAATWPTACEELAFWASPLAEIVRLASHNCAGEAKVGHFWRLPKQQNAFVRHTIFSGAFPTYRLLDQNPARLHKKSRRCSCLRVTGGFFPDPRAIPYRRNISAPALVILLIGR